MTKRGSPGSVATPSDETAEAHGVPADALARALADVPAHAGVLAVMRHSLRERPEEDAPGLAAPLTPAGVELARAAGALLARRPTRLVSSPAPRCVATAAALAEGARGSGSTVTPEVELLPMLAEPRAFTEDIETAGPFFLRHGGRGWVQGVLTEAPRVGARDPLMGTQRILSGLRAHAPGIGGLAVAVTHDTVLAVVLHVLAQRSVRDEALWPRMLEALLLWWEGDDLHWRWRAQGGRWSGR